ncbi:hypothetical protein BDV96DRAFT_642583 [Lophiotrema nucula]|uniref:Uncharacterized protein n=1 Tax=Lophiotrema nucula TaxID=690887 RepID=A0A6A5ZJU9_9PLEO|nr:hypothetical protein BDV96DRAFT_642583 [Lophiotrema nucula]
MSDSGQPSKKRARTSSRSDGEDSHNGRQVTTSASFVDLTATTSEIDTTGLPRWYPSHTTGATVDLTTGIDPSVESRSSRQHPSLTSIDVPPPQLDDQGELTRRRSPLSGRLNTDTGGVGGNVHPAPLSGYVQGEPPSGPSVARIDRSYLENELLSLINLRSPVPMRTGDIRSLVREAELIFSALHEAFNSSNFAQDYINAIWNPQGANAFYRELASQSDPRFMAHLLTALALRGRRINLSQAPTAQPPPPPISAVQQMPYEGGRHQPYHGMPPPDLPLHAVRLGATTYISSTANGGSQDRANVRIQPAPTSAYTRHPNTGSDDQSIGDLLRDRLDGQQYDEYIRRRDLMVNHADARRIDQAVTAAMNVRTFLLQHTDQGIWRLWMEAYRYRNTYSIIFHRVEIRAQVEARSRMPPPPPPKKRRSEKDKS